TGMGWITPLGHDLPSVWARLLEGRNGVGPVTHFDASSWSTSFAAQVKDFRLRDHLADADAREHGGLNTQFALAAAAQAWKQAGLDAARASGRLKARRIGMYLGAGEGSLDYGPFVATNLTAWKADTRRADPVVWARTARQIMDPHKEVEQEPNMVLSHLAAEF